MKPIYIFLVVLIFLGNSCRAQHKTKLIYNCDFSKKSDLDDWKMEGPGIARIIQGKLHLQSKYFDAAQTYYKINGGNFSGMGEAYYEPVKEAMKTDFGDDLSNYSFDGKFRGGHLVFWNKFKTPDNYIIECDFQSLSPNALHMLMFSCSGENGEDVFAPNLKKRWGVAAQYTKSDLHNYRISFYAPGRGTANMRKCPGRILAAKGKDYTLKKPKETNHLKIIKFEDSVEWYINGELSFKFKDTISNGPLGGGQTAIRVMVPAKGLYDNYSIYEIIN